jgi:hypothetical protein
MGMTRGGDMINDECMVNESQEHKRSMPHASWLRSVNRGLQGTMQR